MLTGISATLPENTRLYSNQEIANAAVTIQKTWRGYKVRDIFKKPACLKNSVSNSYFAIGNDPISHAERHFKPVNRVAIVSTGGLQSISSAVRIVDAKKNPDAKKPMIFIIDHEEKIIDFWKLVCSAFKASPTKESFFKKLAKPECKDTLEVCIKKNELGNEYVHFNGRFGYEPKEIFPTNISKTEFLNKWLVKSQCNEALRNRYQSLLNIDPNLYHPHDLFSFFNSIFQDSDDLYTFVKKMLLNSTFLLHNSWCEQKQETFKFIKAICDYQECNILAYPSNIEACYGENTEESKQLNENIDMLSPKITVKTHFGRIEHNFNIPRVVTYGLPAGKTGLD